MLYRVIFLFLVVGNAFGQEPVNDMHFVHIPAGSYMMGSPENERGRINEETLHLVEIEAFEMMTTEVTQAMWMEVMETNVRQLFESSSGRYLFGEGETLPMYYVSWTDAQEFINRLNSRDPGKNYRLPTEEEWEYACRAGTSTRFYSGNTEQDLARVGWYQGNSNGSTHPVAQKQPNNWGLYDMHGNVAEWCSTYCTHSFWTNQWPGNFRVLRGGDFLLYDRNCRSAQQSGGNPDSRDVSGFRIVRDVQE